MLQTFRLNHNAITFKVARIEKCFAQQYYRLSIPEAACIAKTVVEVVMEGRLEILETLNVPSRLMLVRCVRAVLLARPETSCV